MWIRAVLVPERPGRVVQPNLGDKRRNRALAKRTSHGDAVAPVEYVVGAAAPVTAPARDRKSAGTYQPLR